MKLRYIFTALVAGLALLSCEKQEIKTQLDEVQVSQSYVSIDLEGGSSEILLTATDSWTISGAPEWLTITPAAGSAGEAQSVVFSAEATVDGRTAVLNVNCAGKSQYINVIQGLPIISPATCAEVINGIEGKTYIVTGVCTKIVNTQYGNWYLNDGTGEIYIYGTVTDKGEYDWDSFDISVGDEVTVQGARVDYNGTIEFVDALVLSVNKSLIKVNTPEVAPVLPLDGGEFEVGLMCKGKSLSVEIADDAKSWLGISSIDAIANKVVFNVAANEGGERYTTVIFKTTDGNKDYTAELVVTQEGAIVEASIEDFLAAEVGPGLFKLTGKVANLKNETYGNFDLVDATGSVYVYGLTATPVDKNDKSFSTLGIKEGDIVTLIGTRADYNGPQVGGPAYYVSHEGHTEATVAEFLAAETGDSWYKLSGTVANLKNTTYGNFDLVDETGSVYVYGLTVAPVAKNDKSFSTLGIKEGDIVTLIGTRADHNGPQVGGPAYYISHETPSTDEPGTGSEYSINLPYELGSNAYDDGTATVNNVPDLKTIKLGTSSKVGDFTVTVPAGTKKIIFNVVAWKGNTAVATLKVGDNEIGKIENIAGNDGASGNAPYTITVENDNYVFNYEFSAETKLNISTDKRTIFYSIKAE